MFLNFLKKKILAISVPIDCNRISPPIFDDLRQIYPTFFVTSITPKLRNCFLNLFSPEEGKMQRKLFLVARRFNKPTKAAFSDLWFYVMKITDSSSEEFPMQLPNRFM